MGPRRLVVGCAFILFVPGTAFPARGGGEIGGADTLTDKRCQRCLIWTGGVTTAAMAATYVSLDQAWYAQYERTPLHSFNDGDEWLQMDKAGHLFSAYTLGNWGHAAVSHCGASASTSRWVGGSLGLVFLTGVEILDGTSSGWGFSWWDMAANAAGATLFIGQDALWAEQRLQLKLSAHHTEFAPQRPDLLGSGPIERYLKDYNGQTIWLSANLDRFSPGAVPPWLSVAIGYGAERMTSARVSTGDVVVAPMPYRQFYLAPDVDLTRIKTRSRSLRTLLFVLNSIKIPAPTLEFTSEGHFVGHWLYF